MLKNVDTMFLGLIINSLGLTLEETAVCEAYVQTQSAKCSFNILDMEEIYGLTKMCEKLRSQSELLHIT